MDRQRRKKKSSVPGFLSPRAENLLHSPEGESTAILAKQHYKVNTDVSDGGRHSTILFASKSPGSTEKRKEFAIKKQIIKSPVNLADRAYREVYILQQLNKLKNNREFYPSGVTNFVDLVEWFKGKEDSQYMHYVLERADFTLYDLRESPVALGNFRSILFQILFALYVAQETCEFMHNDLHPKNVLLIKSETRKPEFKTVYFKLNDKKWKIDDYLVKITDFGLSRIKLDRRIVYDKRMPYMKGFLRTKDVGEAFDEFAKIKIKADSWVTPEELAAFASSTKSPKKREELRTELEDQRKADLRDLRRLGRNDALLTTILHHPFFEPLLVDEIPTSFSKTPDKVSPVPAAKAPASPVTPASAVAKRKRKLSFRDAEDATELLVDAFDELGLENAEEDLRRSDRLSGRRVTTYARPTKRARTSESQ